MNKDLLKKIEAYSLSDTDIKKGLKPLKVSIIEYQHLPKYKHIDELFKKSSGNFCVLFIPENEQENNGHWTCIMKHKNGDYEYFDSYRNMAPDSEMKWLSKQLKNDLHFNKPFLHDLFLDSGIKSVIFNHYPFQSYKQGINSCGRHTVSRLLHKDLNLNDYWKLIKKSGLNPDEYVSEFVYKIIGK